MLWKPLRSISEGNSNGCLFIPIAIFKTHTFFPFSFFFKLSCFLYLYLRYMWYEGLILNIYSLRLVCGIYFNLLYIIVCFWLYMTINLLEFIALWLICFHDVLALNLWILWRVYWGWISQFSSHLVFSFQISICVNTDIYTMSAFTQILYTKGERENMKV